MSYCGNSMGARLGRNKDPMPECARHQGLGVYKGGQCAECQRLKAKAWNAAHREHCHQQNKRYHQAQAAKVSARKREYYQADKAKASAGAKRAGYRKWREAESYEKPHPGICECCGKYTTKRVYDHCHVTKAFRGWLCNRCNLGLGFFDDTMEGLMNAVRYLSERDPLFPARGMRLGSFFTAAIKAAMADESTILPFGAHMHPNHGAALIVTPDPTQRTGASA